MKIAIVGYGGVGKALIELIYNKKEYLEKEGICPRINYIINSSGGVYNPNGIDLKNLISFTKAGENIVKYPHGGGHHINLNYMLQKEDVDVVIEMTPTNKETGEPGITHIRKSLEKGIDVITANKGPVLLAYNELNDIAIKNNAQLAIGCTTGGALPSVNGGIIDLAGAEILSIEGVFNGTTNFIIKEMEDKGITYLEALKEAQRLGIAETDPTLDVEGWDTAAKLLILTNVLMKEEKTLDNIFVEGITSITPNEINTAKKEGKRLKLIGKTEKNNNKIKMSVKLEKLDPSHSLYGVEGKNKAVRYTSDTLGDLTIIGGASGVTPAAASILRDLINIHRGYKFSK